MNNKERNSRMVSTLNMVANLVGNRQHVNNHEIGLNMTVQHDRCVEEAKNVKDGLFRVVVMGTFTSGKSTLINALLGNKVLPDSALPSTAILTFVQYGANADDIEIHFKDQINADGSVTAGRIEHVTKEEFLNTYQYTNEDNEEFLRTGCVNRFKEVAYSIIRCNLSLMQNGVGIVDSPGLEDKSIANRLTLDVAAQAQAIIYMCGERGFAEADREYFAENFRGNTGNVFFVLNKFDHIDNEKQRKLAEEKLWNDVRSCFIKPDGSVDEQLMKKRVFCLSSLLALDARRGMTFDKDFQKDVPLTSEKMALKMQNSNFLAFEESLFEFLTTDARCNAQYNKVFSTLINTYNDAITKVRSELSVYENQRQITANQKAECERIIKEIETSLNATEAAFNNCTLKLQSTLEKLIRNAVNNVDNTWEIDLPELHEKIRFGMKEYLSLAINNINVFKSKKSREEDIKRILQPFSTVIADYISYKIDTSIKNNHSVLDETINEIETEINTKIKNVSILFERLGDVITETPEVSNSENQNWLQALISYCIGDASMVVRNCAGGKTAWIEFIRKAVFNAIWQWTVIQIMTGGWGVVICGLIEWMQINNGKNEMINRMLTESKNGALTEIRKGLDNHLQDMNTNIASKVNEIKEQNCGTARQQLCDERERLATIEHNLNDNNFNAAQERWRTKYIIDTMAEEIKTCYFDVFGTPYNKVLTTI